MPTFADVDVDLAKLRDYCLSATHPRGRHKARIFRSILGLEGSDAEWLSQALRAAVRDRPHALTAGKLDEYGQRYVLDLTLTTAVGTAQVRSMWISTSWTSPHLPQNVLRFVSC